MTTPSQAAADVIGQIRAAQIALISEQAFLAGVAPGDQITGFSLATIRSGAASVTATQSATFTAAAIAAQIAANAAEIARLEALLAGAISDVAKATLPVF